MSVGTTRTVALQGTVGHLVDVQADLSDGVVGTALVGRGDVSITEARDRCKAAVGNTVFESERRRWPNTKRVTISLSPADLPKRGSHFDLAIACAVLAATDSSIPAAALREVVMIGELTLDGRLRCVPGVLPMVMAAHARGVRRVLVPEPQVDEARMVEGVEVLGVRSLGQVVALMAGEPVPEAPPVEPVTGAPLLSWRGADRMEEHDLRDVLGIPDTRFAVEVAAAGGHHVMLTGPKGSGKTTIAERIPGLLPDLDPQESLELTAVHSLSGVLAAGSKRIVRPPYRSPHHSASRSGLLGGGTGRVRPGEVSRAHLGVLFLDEFPLFPTDVIEALREPLETGEISIARGEEDAVFPARSMIVFACNPCRCGEYHPYAQTHRCRCSEQVRRDYRAKISGPIADRIDITRFVEPLPLDAGDLAPVPFEPVEDTATVRARVSEARLRQARRHEGLSWRLNAHAPGPWLRDEQPMAPSATARLEEVVLRGRLTRRGAVRVHRVAWTLADLAGRARPGDDDLEVALRLRRGLPLLSPSYRRHASEVPA